MSVESSVLYALNSSDANTQLRRVRRHADVSDVLCFSCPVPNERWLVPRSHGLPQMKSVIRTACDLKVPTACLESRSAQGPAAERDEKRL